LTFEIAYPIGIWKKIVSRRKSKYLPQIDAKKDDNFSKKIRKGMANENLRKKEKAALY